MDFVVQVSKLPAPGETVLGSGFQMIPGGKGGNQACAAGRIGGGSLQAKMIGRVGYDLFADHLKASLAADGVDVSGVHATRSHPTGVALIWVDNVGQNSIVVASGANHAIAPRDVESFTAAFHGASTALFQLETPLAVVEAALQLARELEVRTILDPAPAQPLSRSLLHSVDILTPNETEACLLLGRDPVRIGTSDAPEIATALRSLGTRAVILKLGDQGCYYQDEHNEWSVPAFPVQAIDTTAAGDTFNGALAVALAESQPIELALRFANAASAISVTRRGAQLSVPKRGEVDAFLKSCAS
ncbi:MAG TPA: ribokinase [Bryobacteraceae bacterium]|jgi:ribokinase|nr:ribokinase [Bryobacteraceae bacterium]